MKKQLFSSLLFCLVCCCVAATFPQPANAQVEFSKFKLSKDEPFGAFPGRKMLNTKFKTEADVTSTLGIPVLGVIPFIEEKEFVQQ